jgi:hypothetical protein
MTTFPSGAFLLILTLFLGASSFTGSFLSGFGMVAVHRPPSYVSPTGPGLQINGVRYFYVIDVLGIASNQTSNNTSNYLGIGCYITHHIPGQRILPHRGPDCVLAGSPTVSLVLNCNPNECNPTFYGPIPKTKNSGYSDWTAFLNRGNYSLLIDTHNRGTGYLPTFIMNIEYSINNNTAISLKNATTGYTGVTFLCSENECQPRDQVIPRPS